MQHKVFVYGSLKKCGWNHSLLYESTFLGETHIHGYKIYHVASYPGMIKSDNPYEKVFGELYEVDDTTLARLDRLESEGYLYRRDIVSTHYQGEDINAYAYIYLHDTTSSEPVNNNNWKGDNYVLWQNGIY